ncbi:hypothetical protein BaRGS_00013091 [Batillaria attramentaria]|uniref:Uncharacterized protein n=1 Tax=Batillaria attramentaria TaxID=370345 RepID=A0ABD0L7T2_9CAEN
MREDHLRVFSEEPPALESFIQTAFSDPYLCLLLHFRSQHFRLASPRGCELLLCENVVEKTLYREQRFSESFLKMAMMHRSQSFRTMGRIFNLKVRRKQVRTSMKMHPLPAHVVVVGLAVVQGDFCKAEIDHKVRGAKTTHRLQRDFFLCLELLLQHFICVFFPFKL